MDPGNNIARACGKEFSVQRCNFAQFMDFIDAKRKTRHPPIRTVLQGVNPADADTGARTLCNNGLKEAYRITYIGKSNKEFELLRYVCEQMALWRGSGLVDDNLYQKAKYTRGVVQNLRQYASHGEIGDDIRGVEDPEHQRSSPNAWGKLITEGLVKESDDLILPNGLRVYTCNLEAAQTAIRENGKPDFNWETYGREWNKAEKARKEGGHLKNIQELRKGGESMCNNDI